MYSAGQEIKCLQRVCVCVFTCAPTWPLLGGAGNDPLHKTAFHQGLAREPGPLPFGAFRLVGAIWIFSFGVGHHAAIHRLLILLNKIRNTHHKREPGLRDDLPGT